MRAGLKRGIRVVLVVVVLSIVWLQLALPPLPHDPAAAPDSMEPDPSRKGHFSIPLSQLIKKFSGRHEVQQHVELSQAQIWTIWEQLLGRSGDEAILNMDVYGPVVQNTVVIVVQVHNRLDYLRHLIVSLAEVRNIEQVLLVFSHDYYDDDINQLVMTIDFCKVMQVFYPHTLQLHPEGFPGHTAGDCPRDTNAKIARHLQCRGNPDIYGHYREPRYAQTKNHWWWKANKVFEGILSPYNHTGLVLFLEEDHYVSEDLLHMLVLLFTALPRTCPQCGLLTLGNYLKNYNWPADAKKVEISPWLSSKHNMGFAFNRSTWQKIQACGTGFCTHDDYNWDWSLQHVSNGCLKNRLYTMVLRAPRVFHIGECGVHHKKTDCSSKLVLNKVYRTLLTARRALFPLKLIILQAAPKKLKKHKGNGGWGDHRDQELCKSFISSTGPYNPLVWEPLSASGDERILHAGNDTATGGDAAGAVGSSKARHNSSLVDGSSGRVLWDAKLNASFASRSVRNFTKEKVFPNINPKVMKENASMPNTKVGDTNFITKRTVAGNDLTKLQPNQRRNEVFSGEESNSNINTESLPTTHQNSVPVKKSFRSISDDGNLLNHYYNEIDSFKTETIDNESSGSRIRRDLKVSFKRTSAQLNSSQMSADTHLLGSRISSGNSNDHHQLQISRVNDANHRQSLDGNENNAPTPRSPMLESHQQQIVSQRDDLAQQNDVARSSVPSNGGSRDRSSFNRVPPQHIYSMDRQHPATIWQKQHLENTHHDDTNTHHNNVYDDNGTLRMSADDNVHQSSATKEDSQHGRNDDRELSASDAGIALLVSNRDTIHSDLQDAPQVSDSSAHSSSPKVSTTDAQSSPTFQPLHFPNDHDPRAHRRSISS